MTCCDPPPLMPEGRYRASSSRICAPGKERPIYVGIVTNLLVFGLYVPGIGVYLSLLSVLGMALWYILIARALFQLGWGTPNTQQAS